MFLEFIKIGITLNSNEFYIFLYHIKSYNKSNINLKVSFLNRFGFLVEKEYNAISMSSGSYINELL